VNVYEWLRYRWERTAAVVAAVVGLILAIVGWFGVSGSSLVTEQIPYLASGAVGGAFALGVAGTLWLSADLRDESAKLDEIYDVLTGELDESVELDNPPAELNNSPAELEPGDENHRVTARRRPLAANRPVAPDR
jgi:predicted PurR-regulated permease PerM